MSLAQALVPPEHASQHVLVVPASQQTPLEELADAWFPDVRWLEERTVVDDARPMTGARFRGVTQAPTQELGPGVLSLGAEHAATGPFAVTADQVTALGLNQACHAFALGRPDGGLDERGGRPAVLDDRDGIARAFATGLPQDEELRMVQWGVAVARKVGGALLADGRHQVVPDPSSSVDLALYSPHPVSPDELLAQLRSLVATAEVEAQDRGPDGTTRCRLVARTPYDGAILLESERVERVPRALAARDWREYGPHAFRMRWLPQDPYELQIERPSGVHVIARGRMRAVVARLTLLLHARIGGTVVDDGAFRASVPEIERRTDAHASPTRAWV